MPADTSTAPEPAAFTATPLEMDVPLPEYRLMLPLPPVAVTFALSVRLSVTRSPSAASTMLPPLLLVTAAFTTSGLAARPLMILGPPRLDVIVKPDTVVGVPATLNVSKVVTSSEPPPTFDSLI